MKEFKVYIGLNEDNMTQVLHASLKDDASPETFSIQFSTHSGIPLPSRYVNERSDKVIKDDKALSPDVRVAQPA